MEYIKRILEVNINIFIIILLGFISGILLLSYKFTFFLLILSGFLLLLAVRKIYWILYLIILFVPLRGIQQVFIPKEYFLGKTLFIHDILFIFVIIGLLFQLQRIRLKRNLIFNVDKANIFFAFVIIYGFIQGILHNYASVYRSSQGLIFYLIFPFLILILQKSYIREKHKYIFFLHTYFIAINFIALIFSLGLLNFLIGSQKPMMTVGFLRPNYYIDTIIAVLSIFWGILGTLFSESRLEKILSNMCLILGFAVLILSVTRGFIIGFALSLLLLCVIIKLIKKDISFLKLLKLISLFLLVGIFLTYFGNFNIKDVYTNRFLEAREGMEDRLAEAKAYYNSFKENPILGHGFGAPVIIPIVYGGETTYCHNEYLYFLHATGIIGFLIFIFFISKLLRVSFYKIKISNDKKDKLIASFSFITIISFIIISFTSPEFRSTTTVPFLITLLSFMHNIKGDASIK